MSTRGTSPAGGGRTSRPSADDTRRKRQKWLAIGLGAFGALVPAVALIGIVAFMLTYVGASVPAPGDIKQNQVATILTSNGKTIARVVPEEGNRTDVKIEDIPKSVQDAVIAAEDREFASNSGFSIRGLSRAAIGQVTGNGGQAGGGSTITQQYVKNALVGDEHSYERKFKELAIATKMSNEWSKDDIMAAYLNTIYFGRGAYGVAAASQAYFHKDLSKITTEEAAVLAAAIRSPSYYDPEINPEAAQARWNYVLDGMVSTGALTPTDRAGMQYPKVPAARAQSDDTPGANGLIKRRVLAELGELNISEQQVRTEGLKITTTIDPQVQRSVVSAANGKLEGEPNKLRTSVVSIDPRTGGVKGYFGGNDATGWDYAQAGLQTGSSFKVFALVAALEQDIPLSKTYSSAPYSAPGGLTVENSDGESCGSCNLATAMKMSLNTVYYRLMMDLDGQARAVADAAHKAGVAESFGTIEHTLQEANGGVEGGVVLGQYPSRVLDMASAYATLAASGVYREPYFVQKVETSDGEVLFDRQPNKGERVFDAKVADNVSAALEPIASYSNGHALSDPSLGSRPSAAKTGTAQLGDTGQNKDAWMVGYTPQLSTAVWVGTDEGTAITNYAGSSIYGSMLPSDIWQAAMNGALEGKPIQDFPEPEAVGGQAGVPYEPPPVTYDQDAPQTQSPGDQGPSRRFPGNGDGNLTLAPGVTIPLPGNAERGGGNSGNSGGGNSGGNSGGDSGGNSGGNSGGGDDYTGGGNGGGGTTGGGYEDGFGGDIPEPPPLN
ncbi:transglycosylase domain-containing protein [Gordonia sp. Z-3]|jgi:membrane peptidoglycan carboxypeptidase|uniref:transglycosylase domain-containing protein n=1 Tax=Gordonia sp. Z-3 TaxID=3115408 RepID=UPI002E2AFCF0|nr:transglycosylase domain-containing protein [Gordonia sp. Z-3]MED5803751.1 transglycosylase domain-containing protein [Gordonia sp. Z-3]